MQRRLILMRHAKSSWKFPELDDHARPLNKRGRRSAPQVAAALAERGWVPELVVSSDSARTRETWAGMAPALGEPEVVFTERLYHEGLEALIEEAAGWPPEVACVLALGHNPCWEDALVGALRGGGAHDHRQRGAAGGGGRRLATGPGRALGAGGADPSAGAVGLRPRTGQLVEEPYSRSSTWRISEGSG